MKKILQRLFRRKKQISMQEEMKYYKSLAIYNL